MVVVDFLALFKRYVVSLSLIVVVVYNRDIVAELFFKPVCECAFARAGAAGNADNNAIHILPHDAVFFIIQNCRG